MPNNVLSLPTGEVLKIRRRFFRYRSDSWPLTNDGMPLAPLRPIAR